jgi:hypothetical protein
MRRIKSKTVGNRWPKTLSGLYLWAPWDSNPQRTDSRRFLRELCHRLRIPISNRLNLNSRHPVDTRCFPTFAVDRCGENCGYASLGRTHQGRVRAVVDAPLSAVGESRTLGSLKVSRDSTCWHEVPRANGFCIKPLQGTRTGQRLAARMRRRPKDDRLAQPISRGHLRVTMRRTTSGVPWPARVALPVNRSLSIVATYSGRTVRR